MRSSAAPAKKTTDLFSVILPRSVYICMYICLQFFAVAKRNRQMPGVAYLPKIASSQTGV